MPAPKFGRSITFGIPDGLRRSSCLCGRPPRSAIRLPIWATPQRVAGVELSAFLKCCADQVSHAGHPQKCGNRGAFNTPRGCADQVAYAGRPQSVASVAASNKSKTLRTTWLFDIRKCFLFARKRALCCEEACIGGAIESELGAHRQRKSQYHR